MKMQLLIFSLLLSMIGCSQKPVVIKKFIPYYYTNRDTTKETVIEEKAQFDYFIVINYSDDAKTEKVIDSFINLNKDRNWNKYSQYSMIFYKESNYMNETLISKNPKSIDSEEAMECLVYSYSWSNGSFFEKVKEKDGVEIEVYPKRKGRVTMKEIPSPNN